MTEQHVVDVPEARIAPNLWPEAIADASGPQIVVGGPGTGKTEFLVRRVLHLVEEQHVPAPELLVLSFGRRGTADLHSRIRDGLSISVPQIDVATFHSLAARIVERNATELGWGRPPQLLTGPEQVDVVQQLLAGSDRRAWSPSYRGLLGTSTFAKEVTDFLLRTREQVLSNEQLAELARERSDWAGLPEFVAAYDAHIRATGRVDYGTLLASAVTVLEATGPAEPETGTRSYVFVDEYQDTTAAQARLLELLARETGNITAAADPYQSIYSFRGADLRNVNDFPHRFRDRQGRPGRRLVLTTSFRTPQAILEAAVRVTGGDLPGAAGPVAPAPGNGRVDVYRFDQETEEAEWIADEMQRIHLEDGVPYAAMGVFVRTKRRLIPDLVRALHRRNMPHGEPDARLAERSAVRFVLDLVAAATGVDGPAGTARAVRRVLLGPLYTLPLGALRLVERARLSNPGGSWSAAIRVVAPEVATLADLLDDASWAEERPADHGLWHIWNSLPAVAAVVADPKRRDEREAWSSLSQVLRRWNERNPHATLADYRRVSEEGDFEARPLLSYRKSGDDRPTITTLHQSKGLEFDVVFIADAVEGVFPDLRTRDSLLGVRHLMPHLPDDTPSYRAFRLQEERRLAYTAMSRARRRVVWTATAAGFEEGRGVPSRFQALAAGTATVAEAARPAPLHEQPVTPRETEGLLRRIVVDPGMPAPRRLAALTVLAARPDPRLRDPLTYAGMRVRGADTGVIRPGHTLSPSQAEAYDGCPRRYALERRLRIGSSTSVYLEFGSAIHNVLETVEQRALDGGRARGTVEEALAEWDAVFDATAFGGPPFANAWFERGVDALDHLYSNWPGTGNTILVEHPLRMDLDGVTWHGRADRIEREEDGFAIVDYKTSRSVPRVADIEESLQLGFYALAADDDPDLQRHGRPRRAEMWYPAAGGKSVKIRRLEFDNLSAIRDRLMEAARGVLSENWTPRPGGHCERCGVRPLCPAWLEGHEAFS